MGPSPLEVYVAEISACSTADDVFIAFRKEMQREGFENIVFVRYMPDGEHEIPFIELPPEMPRVYLGEKFIESDPVVLSLGMRTKPFMWSDMMREFDWDKRSRHVYGACEDLGCMNGLTIPFHRPNGRCDFFSLSYRQKRTIDPARQTAVQMKAYATWLGINDFDTRYSYPGLGPSAGAPASGAVSCCHRAGTNMEISADECRAIVAVDIAYRRYKAGFIELNATVQSFIGKDVIDALIDRGIIYEDTDDDHWRFVFRPGPIARAHLKSCPAVPYHRDDVCRRIVRSTERPEV